MGLDVKGTAQWMRLIFKMHRLTFGQAAEQTANLLFICSKSQGEREKLLNCVKGLDTTTRETVWGLYFFNSWLFLFILSSPLYLYLETWNHSLDVEPAKNRNWSTSTLSSLQAANRLLLQTRACISNVTTDFCSGFLLARESVAGGGCWSLQGWLCG